MGKIDVIEAIEKIFSKQTNFDQSGFCKADLVTPELADALIHLTSEQRKGLLAKDFGFKWFNPEASDGFVYKWYKNGSVKYCLKLYYNPYYPKEIALMKKGDPAT